MAVAIVWAETEFTANFKAISLLENVRRGEHCRALNLNVGTTEIEMAVILVGF